MRRNGSDVLTFVEPPRADPHAGWCGSLGLALVGQPPATRFTFIFRIGEAQCFYDEIKEFSCIRNSRKPFLPCIFINPLIEDIPRFMLNQQFYSFDHLCKISITAFTECHSIFL